MQNELKQIQHQTHTTFLYVTHDQEEALTMSDRIAVINHGRCVQCDQPETLFRRPRTRFVAGFFRGCNVLEADCTGEAEGCVRLLLGTAEITVPTDGVSRSGRPRLTVAIRAESPHLGAVAKGTDVTFPAILADVVYRGTVVDHVLELADGQRMVVSATRRLAAHAGELISFGLDPEDVVLLED
jgi:ABC-type Fe3+/spermidine/putrescine transport system ATPase subunit